MCELARVCVCVYAPLVVKCCTFFQCECGWNYANWTAETLLKCFKCICMNILAANTHTHTVTIRRKKKKGSTALQLLQCVSTNFSQIEICKRSDLLDSSRHPDPWPLAPLAPWPMTPAQRKHFLQKAFLFRFLACFSPHLPDEHPEFLCSFFG